MEIYIFIGGVIIGLLVAFSAVNAWSVQKGKKKETDPGLSRQLSQLEKDLESIKRSQEYNNLQTHQLWQKISPQKPSQEIPVQLATRDAAIRWCYKAYRDY